MSEEKKSPFYSKGKYTVTINPENSKQYANSSDRYQKVINFLHEKLMSLKQNNIDYVLYIEDGRDGVSITVFWWQRFIMNYVLLFLTVFSPIILVN